MNKIFFLLIISFGLLITACQQSEKSNNDVASIMKDSTKFTTIQWQDSAIDFGTKKMGDIVNITFHCTNTGNKPLYLFDVRPGCGCTLVDYTKQPIEPGKQGKIEASLIQIKVIRAQYIKMFLCIQILQIKHRHT